MSSALRFATQLSFMAISFLVLCSCALRATTAGEPVELARG